MSRRAWITLAAVALAAVVFWRWPRPAVSPESAAIRPPPSALKQERPRPEPLAPTPEASREKVSSAPGPRTPLANPPAAPPPVTMAGQPANPAAAAREKIELDKVNRMLRDYRTLMGENPVGTNAEIMAAVMGGNPRHAQLGPPEGQTVNAEGELVDSWGTPYFFHQLSGEQMEIHSAGPDRVHGTKDDLLWR